ncbi:Ankyrin-2 [Dactylellina cionopaga]|nr:Ankyrin-2 [Dactylellina cionopaga]
MGWASTTRRKVKAGSDAVVRLLLQKGASATIESEGSTPLHAAAANEKQSIIQQILSHSPVGDVDVRDDQARTALHCAASIGNEEAVRLLVEHGCNIDAADKYGATALYTVARHCHLNTYHQSKYEKVLRLLLELQASINATTTKGITVLHEMAAHHVNDKVQLVKFLLDQGADVDARTMGGETALHMASRRNEASVYDDEKRPPLQQAAEQGYEASTRLLLENGALVNDSTTDGNTALDITVYWQQENIISLLFKHGALPIPKSLNNAVKKGNEAIVQKLLQRATEAGEWGHSPYSRIYDRNEVLYTAVCQGHGEIVRMLLENGFDPRKTHNGTELVYTAAEKGYEPIVRSLLKHGAFADVQSRVSYDMAPLHIAVKNGHEVVARTLLEYKARIDLRDSFHRQPLALAVDQGHEALARLLLQYDHKLTDIADSLYLATYRGSKESVQALLEYIANKSSDASPSIHGTTALHVAAERGHHAMLPLLLEHGAKIDALTQLGDAEDRALGLLHTGSWGASGDDEALPASQYGHVGPVRALLDHGAKVHISDKTGSTALVLASARKKAWGEREYNHHGVIKQLLSKGAVDTSDLEGYTGLQRAAARGDIAIVKLLLENGSNIHAKNYSGRQALHHAARNGEKDVVGLLLQHGADARARDDFEETALHHAARGELYPVYTTFDPAVHRHVGVLQILLEKSDTPLNEKKVDRKTALHLAAGNLCKVTVQCLLDHGAEIEVKDYSGRNPFHCAVSERFPYNDKDKVNAILRLLVEYGAQPTEQDKMYSWD